MADLLLDLRHACRGLARRPSFTLLVLLTLGIAVGASAAIFGAAHALLLRPFPFAEPDRLVRPATAPVASVDPNQSYFDVRTMTERIEGSIWQRRAAGSLFMAFAAIAMLLAAVGLYGVLSHIVSQQWRELGVRVALGAQPRDIYRLVVGRGLSLTGLGLAIGVALGIVVARSVSALVFGISPFDPLTFVGVPILIAGVALVACAVPARRATKVDPIAALRAD